MALYIYAMLRLTLIFILSFVASVSFCQIPKHLFNAVTEESYDTRDFTSKSKPIKQRLGVYHFGESEAEWDMLVMLCGDSLIVQKRSGSWGHDLYKTLVGYRGER